MQYYQIVGKFLLHIQMSVNFGVIRISGKKPERCNKGCPLWGQQEGTALLPSSPCRRGISEDTPPNFTLTHEALLPCNLRRRISIRIARKVFLYNGSAVSFQDDAWRGWNKPIGVSMKETVTSSLNQIYMDQLGNRWGGLASPALRPF
jgi:hypothetical protein